MRPIIQGLNMASTQRLEIELGADLRDRLRKLSDATHHSASELAAEAVRGYVELNEWQMGEVRQALKEADESDFATEDQVEAVFAKWEEYGDQVA